MKRLMNIMYWISIISLLAGIVFKLLHYTGADLLMVLSLLVSMPVFSALFLWRRYKTLGDAWYLVAIIPVVLVYIGILFLVNHYNPGLWLFLAGFILLLLVLFGFAYRNRGVPEPTVPVNGKVFIFLACFALVFFILFVKRARDIGFYDQVVESVYNLNEAKSKILEAENQALYEQLKTDPAVRLMHVKTGNLLKQIAGIEFRLQEQNNKASLNKVFSTDVIGNSFQFMIESGVIKALKNSLEVYNTAFAVNKNIVDVQPLEINGNPWSWEYSFTGTPGMVLLKLSQIEMFVLLSENMSLNSCYHNK
jgi:hypothetical protein